MTGDNNIHCCAYIPSEFWKEICLDLKLDSSEFKKDGMRLANEQSQTEYIPHARIHSLMVKQTAPLRAMLKAPCSGSAKEID